MLTEYLKTALRKAHYEILPGDGQANAGGRFGGWGAGGRGAGAEDEAARHLSRKSRNYRTHGLVPLPTIHRFAFRGKDHPHLGPPVLREYNN